MSWVNSGVAMKIVDAAPIEMPTMIANAKSCRVSPPKMNSETIGSSVITEVTIDRRNSDLSAGDRVDTRDDRDVAQQGAQDGNGEPPPVANRHVEGDQRERDDDRDDRAAEDLATEARGDVLRAVVSRLELALEAAAQLVPFLRRQRLRAQAEALELPVGLWSLALDQSLAESRVDCA